MIMDIIESAEKHIREYKDLKERHEILLKNYVIAERWLSVAIGKMGGKIELLADERFEDFACGGGVAFGGRECHYFTYYNAEASGRRDKAAFAEPDCCQKIREEKR